ncbi:class I SAM-dependent methyltransferase [Pseudonocardia sp. WMMC193]|uniref:class I SAM-dependent methyltransferase n=1 Tax=Pseudonocardia sp. WMMC193 TaxID=2911965 RepID=UPI001F2D61ED|nr:class I SAM-dependent methyltransferase [Pseudonocardia sp. WMMC193]MCF7550473.1 class I SAM-dependent methyltransferase [Pseudonocardia sp. WMMC193]
MPTVPSRGDDHASDSHRFRKIAEGFGADAERYDRARPRYPAALAKAVLADLPGTAVLDVGVGTGISSLHFVDAGAVVLGVDPDERMAAVARARGLNVEIASFEQWEPRERRFDGVISGQTWHWVDPVAGARKAAAVLNPGGSITVFWNAGDPPESLAARFAEVYRTVDTGLPFTPSKGSQRDGYAAMLDRAAEGLAEAGGFAKPRRLRFDWETVVSRDVFLDQVQTSGGHNRIAPEKLAELLAGLGAAIDAVGGEFTMRYATVGLVCALA